ncbi:hypothetical protein ACFSX5_05555 [Devosia albogilva]|uniref:CheA signal transduction histidine kinase n=1 Tax=Devosia albogilva TaxID=429726 RepID=A0ABW5QI70_9HYPH
MADYKELLRRAIAALPENNGSARRAVYEKARSALVGQLRAIQPPLPAREITQHRLQLEDCIRQVEQEASEAVIQLGRDAAFGTSPTVAPAVRSGWSTTPAQPAKPEPEAPAPAPAAPEPEPPAPEPVAAAKADEPVEPELPVAEPEQQPEENPDSGNEKLSIEEIIAKAAETSGAEVTPVVPKPRETPAPAITPRNEPGGSNVRPFEPVRPSGGDTRRDATPVAPNRPASEPVRFGPRVEPAVQHAVARQAGSPLAMAEAAPVEAALSAVREVEVETPPDEASEAEGVIQRAIQTLDREARGETAEAPPEAAGDGFAMVPPGKDDAETAFDTGDAPSRSGAGLTIFLVVFAVLLAGVGGAGYWAWREGYVDLEQMFGQGQPQVTETAETTTPTLPPPTLDAPVQPTEETTGPGNTTPIATPDPAGEIGGLEIDDRLEPTPEPVVPEGNETVLPDIGANGEIKSEERLPAAEEALPGTDDIAASVDPAVLAGSQSLLLEASADGRSGAVPFSGSVEWSRGEDELGLPTLEGTASIPARNLSVDVTIRKNSDPALPASHLMEVDFQVSDSFVGGSIASVAGVLLKDEELVTGTPLVGASARVVGNSFLFALSAAENDLATNTELLENRRWLDLAIVYGTGRNAIITLEKDEEAQALFGEVFTTWAE